MRRLFALVLAIGLGAAAADANPPFLRVGVGVVGGGGATQACDGGSSVCAQFQNGQTFVTWDDVGATGAEGASSRYRVYRSTAPINSGNYSSASLVASYVLNNSAQLYGGDPASSTSGSFNQTYRQNASRAMSKLTDLGTPLPALSGLQAYTALGTENAYYAVVSTDTANASPAYIGSAGPISESVGTPRPVKYLGWETRAANKIDAPVTNVPVVLDLHQSNDTSGCSIQACTSGDYWQWWLTPAESILDGRPATVDVGLDHASLYRQNTLVVSPRDTHWDPNGLGEDTGMESQHQSLGLNVAGKTANRLYPITRRGYARMLNHVASHYSADPNQFHCLGQSMGAWGCANTGMRMTSPQLSAIWAAAPMWRMDFRSAAGWPGNTWETAMPFRPTVSGSSPFLGNVATNVLMDDGSTWGGTGGHADMPGWIASNPGADIPVAIWQITKNDGFATWAEQLTAKNAFQNAKRGHAFVWFMGHHDTAYSAMGAINCDWTGFNSSICYSKARFRLNATYLAFSNSSIDDNPGTATTTSNGLFDGDYTGCVNCGFDWTISADSSGAFNFTVDNTFMDLSPTAVRQTTITGTIASSGGGTVGVADASVFMTVSGNPYFLVGGTEVIVVTGVNTGANTITYSTRGRVGSTAQAHSSGETIRQFVTQPTGPNAGPFATMTVDITPRRRQGFLPPNATIVSCDITPSGGGTTTQTPTVANGLFTLTGVAINASGATSVACIQ